MQVLFQALHICNGIVGSKGIIVDLFFGDWFEGHLVHKLRGASAEKQHQI